MQSNKFITISRYSILTYLIILQFLAGCAPSEINLKNSSIPINELTTPENKKLVAVAGFENRSTFAADKLWDTSSQILTIEIVKLGYFKVVEWERMKQLFDWEALSTSSLVKTQDKRNDANKILLCEYFITGAVTYFDVSQRSKISAFSKKKTIDTSIRVDLLLQDANTGEYLSAATGEATNSQMYKGGLTGGQTGTWSSKSADMALSNAIEKALYKLTFQYDRKSRSGS